MNKISVADLHCDLLSYLQEAPNANPTVGGRIGCTIPDLISGNVKFQVMAIYTATKHDSVELALEQAHLFKKLVNEFSNYVSEFDAQSDVFDFTKTSKIKITTAIENASGLCNEDEPLQNIYTNFNKMIETCVKPLYVGLTHHGENRFGGGNSTKVGLKDDGMALIDFLAEQQIALDFSHSSDALADDIINYISKNNIQINIMASHSNFRTVYNHARNLSDDIAKEIIKRNGLIGINLLRAFVNPENENALYDHILYGIELGAQNNLCLGADYFYCDSHPDQTRKPFFFTNHDNASKYPDILSSLLAKSSSQFSDQFAYQNIQNYLFNNNAQK